MQKARFGVHSEQIQPVSLRRNFAWTFTGNALLGASQWAVLSLLAKLGGGEMLGQYALALALAAPVAMLSHLNLRAVLATDMEHRHPFGDYLGVRLGTTALSLAAIASIAWFFNYAYPVAASMVLLGVSLSADNISDIYYAPLQRNERMDVIARSMTARGFLSLVVFGVVLFFTRSLVPSVAALAASRILVLLTYDRPRGSENQSLRRTGTAAQLDIFRTAVPLGVVLMLVSLTTNVPRYAIERYLGAADLGVFAAVAAFLTAGSTIVNALGQSATPRLARFFSEGDLTKFKHLAWRLTVLAALLGAVGVMLAILLGDLVLGIVYRPDYTGYEGLLVAMMTAGICVYAAVVLGYVVTSARSFLAQMPLLAAVAVVSASASWALVPRLGLNGAAIAVALAACVQIAGEVLILTKALRRVEGAA